MNEITSLGVVLPSILDPKGIKGSPSKIRSDQLDVIMNVYGIPDEIYSGSRKVTRGLIG